MDGRSTVREALVPHGSITSWSGFRSLTSDGSGLRLGWFDPAELGRGGWLCYAVRPGRSIVAYSFGGVWSKRDTPDQNGNGP